MLLIFSPLVSLISSRFCQLSSRKTSPACHEPQLARCHVGLRVLLPAPAPGAASPFPELLLLALGAPPAASQSLFQDESLPGEPGDAAKVGWWICPLGTALFWSHHRAGCPRISLVLQRRSGRLWEGLWDGGREWGWVILWPQGNEGRAALPGQEGERIPSGITEI